jgi:transposase
VPAKLDVHLVCDNLATHKTPAIQGWLAKHPRFTIHFTPTGSSWINQVEQSRGSGSSPDQPLKRGVHKSVVALENDVREWIATWNEDPRPFAWTKTAEENLGSLHKYISRISGAGR